MKIAVAFHGKFTGRNSRGEIQGFTKPYKYLEKNILKKYKNVDVFFHGWDDDTRESKKLIDVYKPKHFQIEKQINFKHPYRSLNYIPDGPWNTQTSIFNLYSRFYSLQKSIEQIDDSYDFILISRFDTVFFKPIPFNVLNPDNFYATHWNLNHERWGLNDAWFISGTKIMREFSKIYEKLDEYFKVDGSAYVKFLIQHNLGLNSLTSGHAICRFRCNELQIESKLFAFGLEYETWGLLRRIRKRRDPWGMKIKDLLTPTKI
jgi:hypothetical protein